MILSIKNVLAAFTITTLASLSAQANDGSAGGDKKQIRNEVGIMLNILKASLRQQNTAKKIRFRADSVFYLADQGIVFDIDGGRHSGNFFGFDLKGLISNIPIAPLAPNTTGGSADNVFVDTRDIEIMVERFMEYDDDYEDDIRDSFRELSEDKRELAWETREFERNKRDLEFEIRNATEERKKAMGKNLTDLNKELAKLQQKSKALETYRKELEVEHQKKMAIRSAAKKKLYGEALAIFEDTIGDMLCSYGAGLKSLPIDENITFVISDFVQGNEEGGNDTHDKVYVFKQKDVKSCVTGKINKEQLLTSVNTYLF